jgi:hypothetical protein
MAFRQQKDIGEFLIEKNIFYQEKPLFDEIEKIEIPNSLKEHLDFVIENIPYKISESAVCENIIYPILLSVIKPYVEKLSIWSHKTIKFQKLTGIPDYLIAYKSTYGKVALGKPILAVVEAKKDDFDMGWSQCLLEMYVIQQINEDASLPVYGMVSNGDLWEFGKLTQSQFIRNKDYFTLKELAVLYSFLNQILKESDRI